MGSYLNKQDEEKEGDFKKTTLRKAFTSIDDANIRNENDEDEEDSEEGFI